VLDFVANSISDMGFRTRYHSAAAIAFKGGMFRTPLWRLPRQRSVYLVDSGAVEVRRSERSLAINICLRATYLYFTAAGVVTMLLLGMLTAPQPYLQLMVMSFIPLVVFSAYYSATAAAKQFRQALLSTIAQLPGVTHAA